MKQDVVNQRWEIVEFARKRHDLNTDQIEFMEVALSTRKSSKQRRIDELLEKLGPSDTLIVTELSRLGRSTAEVITLVNELIRRGIRIIVVKQNLDLHQDRQDMSSKVMITLLSLFAELERDLISLRTKEALATKKAQGIKLGKPKGTIQKSKFDRDIERIVDLLEVGLSVRKIAKHLEYRSHKGLNQYVNRHQLRDDRPKPQKIAQIRKLYENATKG